MIMMLFSHTKLRCNFSQTKTDYIEFCCVNDKILTTLKGYFLSKDKNKKKLN